MLHKEKLKSLTKRLHGLLQLSGVDSIVKQASSCQEGPRTVPMKLCRTCHVSLQCSHLADYDGNSTL